jgi:LacI family gluconate utilization system Gnt-I transcriptional repressor
VPHLKIGQIAAEMVLARINDLAMAPTKDVGFKLIPGTTVRPFVA